MTHLLLLALSAILGPTRQLRAEAEWCRLLDDLSGQETPNGLPLIGGRR